MPTVQHRDREKVDQSEIDRQDGREPQGRHKAVLRYLATQPRYDQIDSRFAESAQSGDLGYTWGTWNRRLPPARGGRAGTTPGTSKERFESGIYTRVWVRDRSGQWKVVLDVLN